MSAESEVLNEMKVIRYFIDATEVSEDVAKRAEARGAAHIIQAGSGVVPAHLRSPGETRVDYLRPWILLAARPALPASGGAA